MHNFVEITKARSPPQRHIGVCQFLILRNIPRGIKFESILIKVPIHAGIGLAGPVRIVKRRTSRSHGPGVVGPIRGPGENVRTRHAVKTIRQARHDALFNQFACVVVVVTCLRVRGGPTVILLLYSPPKRNSRDEEKTNKKRTHLATQTTTTTTTTTIRKHAPFWMGTAAKAPSNSPVSALEKVDFLT